MALVEGGRSLLAAGVVSVSGDFDPDDAVEVIDGRARWWPRAWCGARRRRAAEWVGRRSDQLPDDLAGELIHRDDMVVLGE